jgi:thermitase
MAGARANNARGGCGSAPEADLIAVACLNDQVGSQVTLARAVAYAANPATEDATATPGDGTDVISCSLGPNGADWAITSVLSDAITAAATTGRGGRGVPVFWAVTNGSSELKFDKVVSHPQVVAVGRSNRLDLADGSGYGPELAFLAPGREVYSTQQGGTYGQWTGTSYAAPLTAGVAGLVIARYPALTRDQVVARMKANCDRIGGVVYDANGHHDDYGHGRINAEKAVS